MYLDVYRSGRVRVRAHVHVCGLRTTWRRATELAMERLGLSAIYFLNAETFCWDLLRSLAKIEQLSVG